MPALDIISGAILLTLGRRIFWFFVAASGFYAGYELESQYLNIKPEWVAVLIAVTIGVIGAFLAYLFQEIVVGAAGFLAGAFIASRLMTYLGVQVQGWDWLVILLGGLIGIILMFIIFEWALVILSSLAGAILIVGGLGLTGSLELMIAGILFALGIIIQLALNRNFHPRRRSVI